MKKILKTAHPLYRTWRSMKSRCNNPNVHNYFRYGGAGVKVCKRWESFELFCKDMGAKPTPQHSLDRWPNKKGNYSPKNCRWATSEQQSNNQRSNLLILYRGKIKTFAEWCRELGINYKCATSRKFRGYPLEEVFRKVHIPRKSGKDNPKSNKIELYNPISKKRKVVYGLNEAALFLNMTRAGVNRAIKEGGKRRGFIIRKILTI